ncbi:hypothetical protein BS78_06G082000 [Paspalum vaginatum]|nr:hypothetical protein BS78_06G082000 [Paspalum vaginatum]
MGMPGLGVCGVSWLSHVLHSTQLHRSQESVTDEHQHIMDGLCPWWHRRSGTGGDARRLVAEGRRWGGRRRRPRGMRMRCDASRARPGIRPRLDTLPLQHHQVGRCACATLDRARELIELDSFVLVSRCSTVRLTMQCMREGRD